MIISSANDYREAARRRLPPFLFHYIDGGAYAEYTLKRNVEDLSSIALRQRVLKDMTQLDLSTEIFGEQLSLPVALSPVGLTGMYARRGEVQAAMAADKKGIPFTMSTVSVCPIEEVTPKSIALCGFSCMYCVTASSCKMCWSAPKQQAVQRWCLPSICLYLGRDTVMRTRA